MVICTLIGEFVCFRLEDKKVPNFNGMLDTESITEVKQKEMKKRQSLSDNTELSKLV